VVVVRINRLNKVSFLVDKILYDSIGLEIISYCKNVVNVLLLAPVHEIVEHKDGLLHIELSSTKETQQVVVVVLRVICDVIVLDVLPKHF
jgi:hypothetical protein